MAQAPEFLTVDENNVPVIVDRRRRRNQVATATIIVVGLVALVAIFFLMRNWMHAQSYEDAPNAVIESNIYQVGPRIPGVITEVLVGDNERVAKDQVLARLDNKQMTLQEAQAVNAVKLAKQQSESARLQIGQISAAARVRVAQRNQQVSQMRDAYAAGKKQLAEVRKAKAQVAAQLKMAQAHKDQVNTPGLANAMKQIMQKEAQLVAELARMDKAINAPQVSDSEVVAKQLAAASQQYAATQTAVKQAELQLQMVRAAAQYAAIVSPVNGVVAKKAMQVGQRVQPGQPVVAIVEPGVWVTANMDEGQVGRIREGQPVEVKLPSVNRTLNARVASISPVALTQVSEPASPTAPPGGAAKEQQKTAKKAVNEEPVPAEPAQKQPNAQKPEQSQKPQPPQQTPVVTRKTVPVRIEFLPDSLKGAERAVLPGMSAQVSIKVR